MESYFEFFRRVCRQASPVEPFPYQMRFHRLEAKASILKIPTGLGKTDTVIVDWLYRRPTTRLAYCLPGRTLTRQVADVVKKRVAEAAKAKNKPAVKVLELMGQSEDLDLKLSPSEPAILVGTQDILVSRALNRGYARTPFRWPIDFALLNNDVTWVYDEVQLLGDALATSTQLAAFRSEFQTFGETPSVWMSATFDESWLETVDFKEKPQVIKLEADDLKLETVQKRLYASKAIQPTQNCDTPKECASFAAKEHREGTLSLVIANTVSRAQEVWDELRKAGVNDSFLLHSRFRPCDRAEKLDRILEKKNGIVVSTQVIEAGVDIDADLLVTDVAPWSSLVQRFGRVNRYGERGGSRIFWIERPLRSKGKVSSDEDLYAPYEPDQVHGATAQLKQLGSAAPADLEGKLKQPPPYKFVLRKSDLLDLFDTTPDLAGNYIDVSRFVRSGKETNIYAAWRDWAEGEPKDRRRILQSELCPVPISELRAFLKKQQAYTWDFTGRGQWKQIDPRQLYPGMKILFRSNAGGYDAERGWAPTSTKTVPDLKVNDGEEDSSSMDPMSEGRRQTLAEHTEEVFEELRELLKMLLVDLGSQRKVLEAAARYHDWGKAHPVFQQTVHDLPEPPDESPVEILAKQRRDESRKQGHSRRGFRHELASALAMLEAGFCDVCAYIVAAHHGKVRMNIRSMPGEINSGSKRIARGIKEGDSLFPVHLGNGKSVSETKLCLDVTELGISESGVRAWSDRTLGLLSREGPFRLAFLEMLLRIADERASAKANEVKA